MISFAQNMEDVILNRAFDGIRDGSYIDVGAWHPVIDSVTLHFYKLGWSGINIEPDIAMYRQLTNRRGRDINLNIAIGNEPGLNEFYYIPDTGLSTVNPTQAERHKSGGLSYIKKYVKTDTLNAVFEIWAPRECHFLKIDCEGAEADVLRSFDLDRFRPKIILVEATEPLTQNPSHNVFEQFITSRAYKMGYFDGLNRFYCANECASLMAAFYAPPNVFDDFVRLRDLQRYQKAIKTLKSERRRFRARLRAKAER